MKERFVFYRSFLEAIEQYPEEMQLDMFKSVCRYGIHGEEPKFTDFRDKALFAQMKASIDAADQRHESAVERGRKGGLKKTEAPLKQTQAELKQNSSKRNRNINSNNNLNNNSNFNSNCIITENKEESVMQSAPEPAYGGSEHPAYYVSCGFKYTEDGELIGKADD